MKKFSRFVTISAALLFILAGTFKLLAPAIGGSTPFARRAFADMLLQIGVPLPFVFAAAIPALEIIGGIGLIRGQGQRLWAALLALDMIGAIFLVGIPGKSGRVFSVGETRIGDEAWRLPLEILLLVLMICIVFRREESKLV